MKKYIIPFLLTAMMGASLTGCGMFQNAFHNIEEYSDEPSRAESRSEDRKSETSSQSSTSSIESSTAESHPENDRSETASQGNDIYPEDGYAEGRMGDTMHTCFFDYTVNNAYLCDSYGTWEASPGCKILVAEVTIKNTSQASIPMYDTDFQIQWNDTSEDAYDWPLTYYTQNTDIIGENVLPTEYKLSINDSRAGLLIYEVPEGENDFSISYMEYFDDDSTGDLFFVYFSAEEAAPAEQNSNYESATCKMAQDGVSIEIKIEAKDDIISKWIQTSQVSLKELDADTIAALGASMEDIETSYAAYDKVDYNIYKTEDSLIEVIIIDMTDSATIKSLVEANLLPVEGDASKLSLKLTLETLQNNGWTIE